ncbi:MAG: T9SS type A sorting domain-containing protein, partial [Bacteroidetes bacterium]|nr:T9SS type A sorting domain-containing protein [Bacteroidota bacterium]
YDILGNKIHQINESFNHSGRWKYILDENTGMRSQGTYIVVIRVDGAVITRRIVKM